MPFRAVLKGLLARHQEGVRGAVFCDEEGERVEALINDPRLDPYDLDLAGASYASVVNLLGTDGDGARMRIVLRDEVVWLQVIKNRYYVLLLTVRDGYDVTVAPLLDEVGHALEELM
jgi:hypothetical protein